MSDSPRFIFFGTPECAVYALNTLEQSGMRPEAIVTRIDKPVGRKQELTAPPVKIWGAKRDIPILQPEKFDDEISQKLKEYAPDIFIVAAYGKIIPKKVLDIPKYGSLNIHPSLLPKYRGSTPIQSAILSGDNKTGITIMVLDEEMDHGPILAQESSLILEKTTEELERELFTRGGELLAKLIPLWIRGEIKAVEQNHQEASIVKKFDTEDAYIDPRIIFEPNDKAEETLRKVRALNPEPGTWTELGEKKLRVKILSAKKEDDKLLPIDVIPAGKKKMLWKDFVRGMKF